jgi:hypothetical protein
MSESKDIHNTMEVLVVMKKFAIAGKVAFKDGKLNTADIPVLLGLLKEIDAISAAVKDAEEVPKEIKDIDQAEAAVLLSFVVAAAKEFKEA